MSECTCYWTDPSTWFTYYGAVEPGSQMEPNPDCPVHFPAEEARREIEELGRRHDGGAA